MENKYNIFVEYGVAEGGRTSIIYLVDYKNCVVHFQSTRNNNIMDEIEKFYKNYNFVYLDSIDTIYIERTNDLEETFHKVVDMLYRIKNKYKYECIHDKSRVYKEYSNFGMLLKVEIKPSKDIEKVEAVPSCELDDIDYKAEHKRLLGWLKEKQEETERLKAIIKMLSEQI